MLRKMMISCGLMVAAVLAVNHQQVTAQVRSQERLGEGTAGVSGVAPTSVTTSPDGVTTDLPVELRTLRDKVRQCLGLYYRQPDNVAQLTPWELMHASLAIGVDTEVFASAGRVNALGWLCWNGNSNGRRLLAAPGGSLRVRDGYGLQGHDGQFLSILAQSKVRIDSPIKAGGYDFTVADLVEREKATCRASTELTFKLIGLVHYLDSDASWKSEDGQTWNIPRLIKEEIKQSVIDAACGGTHRLTGLSYAVRKRDKRNEPYVGEWQRAKEYVEDFHEYAFELQNSDGSFSTNWFEGRGDWRDDDRRLNTTGHTLEWLVCSLPEDELRDPRVTKAVTYLADLLAKKHGDHLEMGALGHAMHALTLYDERVFGSTPGNRKQWLQAEIELAGTSSR